MVSIKSVMVLAGLLALGGCASDGSAPWLAAAGSCSKLAADDEMKLNLAQDMAGEGRLHAALANLEGLPDSVDVRLRKAQILRQLGSSDAQPLYRSLLATCRRDEGEHGLGQLAAARGDNDEALIHLLAAVKLAPTNEKIRNDLGVVYLNQLKLEQARFQFLTAMELKQSDTLAAENLLTMLLYQDNWSQAAEWVTRNGLSPDQFNDARARAEALKKPVAVRPAVVEPVAAVAGQSTLK